MKKQSKKRSKEINEIARVLAENIELRKQLDVITKLMIDTKDVLRLAENITLTCRADHGNKTFFSRLFGR